VPFTALYPDFEDYFETVRKLAGEPTALQPGRKLPKFRKEWNGIFEAGHKRRVLMWKKSNEVAKRKLGKGVQKRAKL
jgi:hypothetical protein